MDYLRSCYSTTLQIGDGPDATCDIDWFFVPDDRPVMKGPTPFRSNNWLPDWDPTGGTPLGEIIGAPRPWRDGGGLPVCYTGRGKCGTDEQWRHGIGTDRPPPPPLSLEGCPGCCTLASELLLGGGQLTPFHGGPLLGGGELTKHPGGILPGGGERTPHGGGLLIGGGATAQDLRRGGGLLIGGGQLTKQGGGILLGGGSTIVFSAGCNPHRIQSGKAAAAGVSVSVTWPAPTTAGNLLFASVSAEKSAAGAPTITAPAGWTSAGTTSRNNLRGQVFYRANAASQTTTGNFTHSGSGGAICVVVGEYSPIATISPADLVSLVGSGTNNSPSGSWVSPATGQACEMALWGVATDLNAAAVTSGGGGYSLVDQVNDGTGVCGAALLERKLTAVGVFNPSCLLAASTVWVQCLATFKSP